MRVATVVRLLGWGMSGFGGVMAVPALLAAVNGEPESLAGFLAAAAAAVFFGVLLIIVTRGHGQRIGRREMILLAVLVWPIAALLGALPLHLGGGVARFGDAYFEALSALTTTGLSVLADPALLDRSQLLWRALMQWIGGLATILLVISILPPFALGGALIERGAPGGGEPPRPSLRQAMSGLGAVYGLATLCCALLLAAIGLPWLEAACYAMSTLSTGGLAVDAGGPAKFGTAAVELVLTPFMLFGAMSFTLHLRALHGRPLDYERDPECRLLAALLLLATIAIAAALATDEAGGAAESLRHGLFVAASVITTTGYGTGATIPAPTFLVFLLLGLAIIGSASGSTGGGIKLVRLLLLLREGGRELARLVHPHSVIPIKYGGAPVSATVVQSVWGFVVGFMFCMILLAVGLAGFGLDLPAAVIASVSALANSGPMLGELGGEGIDYAALPAGAKGLLGLGMVIGRLELLALLVLFSPLFWRE